MSRCVFKGPYYSTLRVLNFWLPINSRVLNNWIEIRISGYTLKFAPFSLKQTDLLSIHKNWGRSPKFLTDNQHDSHKSGLLICIINKSLINPFVVVFSSDAIRCLLRKLKTLLAVNTDMNLWWCTQITHVMMQQHELWRITKLLFLLCKQLLKLYTDTEYEYLWNNWECEAYK